MVLSFFSESNSIATRVLPGHFTSAPLFSICTTFSATSTFPSPAHHYHSFHTNGHDMQRTSTRARATYYIVHLSPSQKRSGTASVRPRFRKSTGFSDACTCLYVSSSISSYGSCLYAVVQFGRKLMPLRWYWK